MAPPPPMPPPLFLIFVISCTITTPSLARLYDRHLSTTEPRHEGMDGGYRNIKAHAGEVAEELFSPGVVRSSPARPMPSYNQNAAPVPLPEFPTLGPPVVWSFPAAPLPAIEPPPPQDIPILPGTKHDAPRPCHGHHYKAPPPSGPVVATEPVVSPGSLEAPENAPEPTAGGGPSPPY